MAASFNAAAGSLGERAVALKIANLLASPAIVMRNDQQDALGMGLGITEYAPCGKSAKEIRELWQRLWERLISTSQLEAGVPAPLLRFASRTDRHTTALIDYCYKNSANCYLRKPTDWDAFNDLARIISSFWLLLVRLPTNRPPDRE